MKLQLNIDLASTFSLAAQQNAYSLLKRVLLSAPASVDGESLKPVRDIRIRLTSAPPSLSLKSG